MLVNLFFFLRNYIFCHVLNKIIVKKLTNNPITTLGNLVPNSTYKVNNTDFLTDRFGRIKEVYVSLLKKTNYKPFALNKITESNKNTILPLNFGGNMLDLNKTFILKNSFKELFVDWNSALSKNIKIKNISITSIYKNSKSKIADGFNVSYMKQQKIYYRYFPNDYNKKIKAIFDEMKQPVIGKHVKTNLHRKAPVYNLSKDVILNGNKLMYKNKEFGDINPITNTITIYRRKAINKDGLNPILSNPKLAKNQTYYVIDGKNSFKYKTNNKGIVGEIEANIIDKPTGIRVSKEKERTKTKHVKDEISSRNGNLELTGGQHKKMSDEAGHYIGDAFGGIPETINMFPQAFKLNRGTKWKNMETTIKNALKNGNFVNVRIKPIFDGVSKRPLELVCEYTINGKKEIKRFQNVNYSIDEII